MSQPVESFELFAGNADANIIPGTTFSNGGIELMAINQEGEAGILPPNYSGVFDIKMNPIQNLPDSQLSLTLSVLQDSASLDLSSLVNQGPMA